MMFLSSGESFVKKALVCEEDMVDVCGDEIADGVIGCDGCVDEVDVREMEEKVRSSR